MKKIHIILLVTLGLFLIPSITYACGSKSEKKCCKKEASAKSEKKECCDKSSDSGDNKGCAGKCGKASCSCSEMVNVSFLILPTTYLENYTVIIASEKKAFHYKEIYASSAFDRLRLPPKIS